MNNTDTSITHVTSSDSNIFEELGFSEQEATKLKIKAQLMCSISEWIKDKELKQEDASHVLQITRPRVSDVMRGKSSKFTIFRKFEPNSSRFAGYRSPPRTDARNIKNSVTKTICTAPYPAHRPPHPANVRNLVVPTNVHCQIRWIL